MLTTHFKRTPDESGFALVATLIIVPLLVLLAVSLLGISSIELRKSSTQLARLEARANARMALEIAIGELQANLGPDQRTSSDSRILDGSPAGVSSSLTQPHWVNVWRTTEEDGTPFITRDAEDGGLRDSRASGGWDAASDRIATLVSGNEDEFRFRDGPDPALPAEEEMIELVGKGSVGETDDRDRVSAPRVDLMEGEVQRGSYAWWVGDLGIKANVAVPDASKESSGGLAGLRSTLLSQDASLTAVDGQPDLENDVRAKLASQAQLSLAANDSELARRTFHDFTTDSLGLLTDVREGGLKKDLSAYLASDGNIPDLGSGDSQLVGLSDGDRLVGPRNTRADARSASPGQAARFDEVSPGFGLLRDWAKRAEDAGYGAYRTAIDPAGISGKSTNGRNRAPVEFRNRSKTDITPVLVEGSIYYNLSYYKLAKPDPRNPYGMRLHLYPRVAMWNPYNFDLNVGSSMIFIQLNGKKMVEVSMAGNRTQAYRMYWGLSGGATGGSQQGSLFFKLEGATLGPGETLVWSPRDNSPYNETVFSANVLSPSVAPSPGRSFYQDSRSDGYPLFQVQQSFPPKPGLISDRLPAIPVEWREFVPPRPGGNVQSGGYTQADDYVMLWKPLSGSSGAIDLAAFGELPQGRFVSCAYQYGDEDEMPVEWNVANPVPFLQSSLEEPAVSMPPDRRTRDGFRLRWFDEPASNRIGSGSLAGTAHLESAPVANWNMRASYSFRSPFENVTDVSPNFFGIYTRDLFDAAVDWSAINPRYEHGVYRGDPFDQPVRFTSPRVLFDIPRTGAEISSLGAFQHVSFSEFIWHPTYALGNSLADPRIELTRTEPNRGRKINSDKGGWNQDSIGYALDGRSDPNGNNATTREDNWSWHARALLQHVALDQSLIYDLSYELNHSLWDEFFLSSGKPSDKASFLLDPAANPLPNGRMRLYPGQGGDEEDLLDLHRAASKLAVEGAFNVNSTSATAWEAMLLSSIGAQYGDGTITFPRIPGIKGGPWDGTDVRSDDAWSGQRTFTRDEIRRLAEEIITEVKARGPFLSLADFVNRRLSDDESGRKGALQAAIDRAGLNARFDAEWPLDNSTSLPDFNHIDHIQDPTRIEQRHKPSTTAWGAPGFLTQADVLQFLGPALSARSDTFVVRAYGSSTDGDGKVRAKAWCEAVVQRSPVPLAADDLGLNPEKDGTIPDMGRRFEIQRFRWLSPDEV
ncbi:hypothetical protein [Luteolibacter marinus]|uniref:hypothetical protein n=1 Tax=Luteolibacter marinus TaxID=2776705 RepID=UPI00186862F8|nr:hypothetical protein [Luteolibacter marinus]